MNEHQLSQLERLGKLKEQGVLTDEELAQQKAQILGTAEQVVAPPPLPPSAPAPRPTPPKQKMTAGQVAVALITIIAVLLIIGRWTNETPADSALAVADTSSYMSGDTATSTVATPPPAPTNWSYSDDTDKMGGRTITASTDSKNELQFDFPYNGGSIATLTVRRQDGANNVYVRISKGQLLINSYEGSSCRVRFDDSKPVTYSILGPSDQSNDIFFISSANAVIKRLKKAKTVVIEAEFYQGGIRQMEFDVSNLKWKY